MLMWWRLENWLLTYTTNNKKGYEIRNINLIWHFEFEIFGIFHGLEFTGFSDHLTLYNLMGAGKIFMVKAKCFAWEW